jgi:YidC/Oxa1 family membrane protein insertase
MQKQMMARNMAQMADNPMAQQQKILLYAMPIFLAVISFQFPLGILLYWVTTNLWQVVQQAIILREVKQEAESGELADKPGGDVGQVKPESKRRTSGSATSGGRKKPVESDEPGDEPEDTTPELDARDAGTTGKATPSPAEPEAPKAPKASKGPETPKSQNGHGPSSGGQPAGTGKRDHLPRRGSARS